MIGLLQMTFTVLKPALSMTLMMKFEGATTRRCLTSSIPLSIIPKASSSVTSGCQSLSNIESTKYEPYPVPPVLILLSVAR